MTKNTELNRDLIMASMSRFYAHKEHMSKLVSIVEGKSSVSLRLIDWFVTNYCKKHNVEILRRNMTMRYNIYTDYRSQLKAFSKHNFDPFKRRDRIRYFYNTSNHIITTVGQLNFFKWAIENCVIDYIDLHQKDIENDMTFCYNTAYVAADDGAAPEKVVVKEKKCRKKRNELCRSSQRHVNIHSANRSLTFE